MNREELFWSKVDKSGDCWKWTGAADENGYGFVMYEGRVERSHRIAYRLTHGQPKNNVLHTCDNPPCVRPSHLFDGTQKENVLDMARKDRHGNMKITMEQANWIRIEVANGKRGTMARLARELEVSASCIRKIVIGERRV